MGNENKRTFFKTLPGILTGIAALITALTGLYIAIQSTRQPKSPGNEELSQHMKRAKILAEDFLTAYQNDNISKIIHISATPFYFLHEVLFRPEDISRKLEEVFSQKGENFKVETTEAKTIEELRKAGINLEAFKWAGSTCLARSILNHSYL